MIFPAMVIFFPLSLFRQCSATAPLYLKKCAGGPFVRAWSEFDLFWMSADAEAIYCIFPSLFSHFPCEMGPLQV